MFAHFEKSFPPRAQVVPAVLKPPQRVCCNRFVTLLAGLECLAGTSSNLSSKGPRYVATDSNDVRGVTDELHAQAVKAYLLKLDEVTVAGRFDARLVPTSRSLGSRRQGRYCLMTRHLS